MEIMDKVLALLVIIIAGLSIGMYVLNVYAVDGQRVQVIGNPGPEQYTNTAFNQTVNLLHQRVVPSTISIVNATCESVCTSSPNSTLRSGIEYQVSTTPGYVVFINRTGTWNVTYSYLPAAYIGGTGSTILSVSVILFAAIVLVLIYRKLFGNGE